VVVGKIQVFLPACGCGRDSSYITLMIMKKRYHREESVWQKRKRYYLKKKLKQ
jgi:hypothetical protein